MKIRPAALALCAAAILSASVAIQTPAFAQALWGGKPTTSSSGIQETSWALDIFTGRDIAFVPMSNGGELFTPFLTETVTADHEIDVDISGSATLLVPSTITIDQGTDSADLPLTWTSAALPGDAATITLTDTVTNEVYSFGVVLENR